MPNQPSIDTNYLIGLDGNLYNMTTISSNLNLVIPVQNKTPDIINLANNCKLNSTYAVIGDPCSDLRNVLLSINPSSGGEPLYSTIKIEPDTNYTKTINLQTTDNTTVTVNTNINIPPSTVISLPKLDISSTPIVTTNLNTPKNTPVGGFTSTIYPIETFGKSHNISLQFILIILSLVLIGYCYYDKN